MAEMRNKEVRPAPSIGPIEHDSDGNALRMNHEEATFYCKFKKRSRLPTAREYAERAVEMGALGISEDLSDKPEKEKVFYYPVKVADGEGNADHFYFSHNGYKPDDPDENPYVFWSSSLDTPAYIFIARSGELYRGLRNEYYWVRCIANE